MTTPSDLLFSRKALWRLVWPLMVEQLLAITLGIADIIMVASLGESAVSGVSLVDSVYILINNLLAALATGGAVVCSQFIGQKRADMASRTAIQLLYTLAIGSIFTMLLGLAFNRTLLTLLFGGVESEVLANAQTYFRYMLFSLPSIAVYNGCAALFRAQGNSRISMYIAILVNAVNIGGNAILLYGLGLGVEGVAIPTLIARTCAAAILFSLLLGRRTVNLQIFGATPPVGRKRPTDVISIRGIRRVKLEPHLIKKILQIGIPTGLENSIFQVGKVLVVTLIASFGTGAIAANAASNTISSFEVLPAAAIGLALLTVVGQCMGAGRADQAVYYTKRLMAYAYALTAALNLPLLFFSKQLIGLYGMSEETTLLGWRMLMCHGICAIVFWPTAFTLPNVLRAANDAKFTMTASLISMWTVRIGMSYLLAIPFGLGAFGTWIAMSMDWVARSAAFVARFASGRWKTRRLV